MIGLGSINWGDIGGWGAFGFLALFVTWMVLSGRLIPRKTHLETVEEKNHYRTASTLKDETIGQLTKQIGELRVVGRVQVETMRAIRGTEEANPS